MSTSIRIGAGGVRVKKCIASLAIAGAAAAALASVALATPGSNIVGTIIVRAGFADPVDIKLKLRDALEVIHVAQAGDTVMQQIIIGPGIPVGTATRVRRSPPSEW
jgi:hypothetical protein